MATRKFDIAPDQSEINALDRDLRFYPAQVEDPAVLTQEQIAQFNQDGYLKGLSIFGSDEIDGIRSYFDALLERTLAQGGDSYSISSAHLRLPEVYDLLTDPRIVNIVGDLLGENLIGWGSHFFCKLPHDGKTVAWHQDASYWPLSPSKAVTVWLAIDEADLENACMKFVAGSHHVGHLTYRPSDSSEHNVLNQSIDNAEDYGTIVNNELSAGQISIHSDLLLHGSAANDSDRRRCGLTLRYCAADVYAHMGWNEKGVIVRGVDSNQHWSNLPRPQAIAE